jgi:acyl carrier protein
MRSLADFGADPDVLTREATLEEVDVDSLDLVELTQVVEDAYDIDLENADFKKVKTVGDVIDLVVERVG